MRAVAMIIRTALCASKDDALYASGAVKIAGDAALLIEGRRTQHLAPGIFAADGVTRSPVPICCCSLDRSEHRFHLAGVVVGCDPSPFVALGLGPKSHWNVGAGNHTCGQVRFATGIWNWRCCRLIKPEA
jgi:hypothetical protein